jgi:hypothetical protein
MLFFQGEIVLKRQRWPFPRPTFTSSTKSHPIQDHMISSWWIEPLFGTFSMVKNSKMDFIPFFSWSYVIKKYYSMGLASNQLWMSKPRNDYFMREVETIH